MKLIAFKSLLERVLPNKVVYETWPVGEAPALPYICYMTTGTDTFGADNITYFAAWTTRVELYTEHKDFTLEASLEDALNAAGLYWTRDESYISDEKLFLTIYEVILHGREQS